MVPMMNLSGHDENDKNKYNVTLRQPLLLGSQEVREYILYARLFSGVIRFKFFLRAFEETNAHTRIVAATRRNLMSDDEFSTRHEQRMFVIPSVKKREKMAANTSASQMGWFHE